jgi:hypothetical protein
MKRLSSWVTVQQARGYSKLELTCSIAPRKVLNKLGRHLGKYAANSPRINQLNVEKFQRFQQGLCAGKTRVFIIALPWTLHFLLPCLNQIPSLVRRTELEAVLIVNGLSHWEKSYLDSKFDFPHFDLDVTTHTPLSHGDVLNILFECCDTDFAIVDHDLYGISAELWDAMLHPVPELLRGIFPVTNPQLDWQFPRTHFMFFNTGTVRRLMRTAGIGAHRYHRVPAYLVELVESLGLHSGQYLKPYLNYFDAMNLIMLMAKHEGMIPEFPAPGLEKCVFHVGSTSGRAQYDSNLLATYTDLKFLELVGSTDLRNAYAQLSGKIKSASDLRPQLDSAPGKRAAMERIDAMTGYLENLA